MSTPDLDRQAIFKSNARLIERRIGHDAQTNEKIPDPRTRVKQSRVCDPRLSQSVSLAPAPVPGFRLAAMGMPSRRPIFRSTSLFREARHTGLRRAFCPLHAKPAAARVVRLHTLPRRQ